MLIKIVEGLYDEVSELKKRVFNGPVIEEVKLDTELVLWKVNGCFYYIEAIPINAVLVKLNVMFCTYRV